MARISGILLDVDGTLYHSRRLRYHIGLRLVRSLLYSPGSTLFTIRILSHYRKAQEWLRRKANHDLTPESQLLRASITSGIPVDRIKPVVKYWMEELPLRFLPLCRRETLFRQIVRWHEQGIPIGAYSDYPAEEKIKALGLNTILRVICCSTDCRIGTLKPHTRGFILAAEELGIPPEEIVYIGDRPDIDALGARNAGMRALTIKEGPLLHPPSAQSEPPRF